MERRSKEMKKPQMMVHDTATVMDIANPALPTHPVNCMMVSSVVDVMIGFTLLALAWKYGNHPNRYMESTVYTQYH
jgi:hypothetical protein